MKKIAFVTGSTGFLGLNLVELLVQEGWEVYALHRASSNLKYLNRFPVHKIQGDVTDLVSLQAGIPDGIDVCFHLAASTNLWKKNNALQTKINVEGTKNILQVIQEKQIPRLVHTSSIVTYGLHDSVINEQTKSNALEVPINYFISKRLADLEVEKAVQKQGLHATILHPSHIMGPYDFQNWVQLIKHVYNNTLPGIPPGSGPFSHVREIAKAHIRAAEVGRAGEHYVLGGDQKSFLDLINQAQRILNKKQSAKATPAWMLRIGLLGFGIKGWLQPSQEPDLTPEKFTLVTKHVRCDDKKAQEELGFQHIPMPQIVEECIAWLQKEKLLD